MEVGIIEKKIRIKLIRLFFIPLFSMILLGICLIWYGTEGVLSVPAELHLNGMKEAEPWLNKLAGNFWLNETTRIELTVTLRELSDIGYVSSYDGIVIRQHVGFDIGNKRLFISMKTDELERFYTDGTYTIYGSMESIDPNLEDVYIKDMMSCGYSEKESMDNLFAYTITERAGSNTFERIISFIPLVFLLGLSLVTFFIFVIPLLDIKRYYGLKKLPRARPFNDVLCCVEQQYKTNDHKHEYHVGTANTVTLTPNWIIIETLWSVRVYLADEFLWAYIARKHMRVGGSIYLGDLCLGVIVSKSILIKLPGNQKQLDALMEGVTDVYPWIMIGYTPGRNSDWENELGKIDARAKHKKQSIGFIEFDS